ncbi:dihydroorotase [bacterium]|nr:dihydroorotase [bacterium]
MKIQEFSHYTIGPVTLWTSEQEKSGMYAEVKDGKLVQFSDKDLSKNGVHHIDGKGRVLMPAGIDAQVHLRVPGQEHKETVETGLSAALKGGYCALLTMPNTNPTIDQPDKLKLGMDLVSDGEKKFGVKVYWTAAITKNLNSSEVTPIEDLAQGGMKALTNDGLGVLSDEVMSESFRRLALLNIPLLQHAEFLGHGGSLAPSSVQKRIGAKPYPESAELDMVERDLRVLKSHPQARYHILHITSGKVLPMVREAKAAGLKVTCEVTPHHLYFSGEDIDPENKSFKMNPPLRSPEDRDLLWKGLESGDIDFVSTDHAPHEALVKQGDFDQAAFGTIGMETTLGVLLWGLKNGKLSRKRLIEVFSQKPAQFLSLDSSFGNLIEGQEFRAVLFDTEAPEKLISSSDFMSLSKNSCFIGSRLPGHLDLTFIESRVVSFES